MASVESALEEERQEILKLLERPTPSANVKNANPRSPPLAPRTSSPFRGRPGHGSSMGALDHLREDDSPSPPPSEPRAKISRDPSPVYQNLTQSISSSLRNRRASSGQSSNRTGSFSASSPPSGSIVLSQAYQDQLASIYDESGPLSSGGFPQLPRSTRPATSSSMLRTASPTMQNRSSSPIPGQLPFPSPLSSPLNMGKLSPFTKRSKSQGAESLEGKKAGLAGHARANSVGSNTTDGGYRLDKDSTYTGQDGKEVAIESSDESSDDSDGVESSRGRRVQSSKAESKTKEDESFDPTTRIMSLLAAADDDERKSVSPARKKSFLTSASSMSQNSSKGNHIHPNTNFDVTSRASTPFSSDTEENAIDLKRALRMSLNVSPIISTPETHRLVRTITRGDFAAIREEYEKGQKKERSYLVATDLSAEATHALEWTIGTVLRDGDTLLAIYAIDDESLSDTSTNSTTSGAISGVSRSRSRLGRDRSRSAFGTGRVKMSEEELLKEERGQASDMVENDPSLAGLRPGARSTTPAIPSPLSAQFQNETANKTSTGRERSKTEKERWNAAEDITGLITKLLRKTRLQVHIVVEVIHCKSPKHLLTEMIDILEPTLVVLGSRGRSALKGVLLGSFSNYLVTKSSVPVMVARRKLKHSKYKKTNIRLANNLTTNNQSKTLALAKVD